MTGHDPEPGARPDQAHTPGDRDVAAELAAELAALRRCWRETDDIARESAGVLSELAPQVADLEAHLDAREVEAGGSGSARREDPAVTARKAELGMLAVPPAPWCWPLLDPEQATAAWDALARWVDQVLVAGYTISRGTLLDCWPLHPPMVNELSWLRASHLEAHTVGAPAMLAQDWHLRALPGALAGLRAAVPVEAGGGGRQRPLCGPGHHHTRAGVHDDTLDEQRIAPARREHWDAAWREVTARHEARSAA